MTKIRLTRRTTIYGKFEYIYQTDTHRYVTVKRGAWWVTDVYTLRRVGEAEPPLMIGDDWVSDMMNITLADVREEIAQDVEKRRAAR